MDMIFETMIGALSVEQLQQLKKRIEDEISVKSGEMKMLPSEIAGCKSKNGDGFYRRIDAIRMVKTRLNLDLRNAVAIVDTECPR